MYWDNHNMGSGDWIAMTFAMVAFWSILVVAVIVIRKEWTTRTSGGPPAERTALQTLDERFASGDIDVDEYRTRREILSDGP